MAELVFGCYYRTDYEEEHHKDQSLRMDASQEKLTANLLIKAHGDLPVGLHLKVRTIDII